MRFKPFKRNVIDWLLACWMWFWASAIVFIAFWTHTRQWLIAVFGVVVFLTGGFALVESNTASE